MVHKLIQKEVQYNLNFCAKRYKFNFHHSLDNNSEIVSYWYDNVVKSTLSAVADNCGFNEGEGKGSSSIIIIINYFEV